MTARVRRTPILRFRWRTIFRTDNLRLQRVRRRRSVFEVEIDGRRFNPTAGKSWKTNAKACGAGRCGPAHASGAHAPVRPLPRRLSRSAKLKNLWTDTGTGFADREGLRRADQHEGRRAMHAHDHRPRRPRPRPDLWLRHDRVRRRAVGPAMDHRRHQPRRIRARAHRA